MEAKKKKEFEIQESVFLKLSEILHIIKLCSYYYYKIFLVPKIIILPKPWKI